MPETADATSPFDFARVRALFDRACQIPPAERTTFVQREAHGDERLAAYVLELLANATQALPNGSLDEVRKWLDDHGGAAGPVPDPDAQHRVQATATDELMERLVKAPRFAWGLWLPPQSASELGDYVFVFLGFFIVMLLVITLAAILVRDKGPPRS